KGPIPMIKRCFALLCTFLLLAGCMPDMDKDEVVQKEDEDETNGPSIVPSYQLSKENYRTVLPFRPSAARGVTTNQVGNRLDIDELEEGLRRHSKEFFDPGDLFYEAGQYFTEDMVYEWIDELNPEREDLPDD